MAKHRKPRGKSGGLKVTAGTGVEFLATPLPDMKDEIEALLLEDAVKSAKLTGCEPLASVRFHEQNGENDFDFTIATPNGCEYLDLVEVAPLDGGGYANVPDTRYVGEMGDYAYDCVYRKAQRYGFRSTLPVHLLLYSTDDRLHLHEADLGVLTQACSTTPHPFRTISYYYCGGMARAVFGPTVVADARLDPLEARARDVRRLDLSGVHSRNGTEVSLNATFGPSTVCSFDGRNTLLTGEKFDVRDGLTLEATVRILKPSFEPTIIAAPASGQWRKPFVAYRLGCARSTLCPEFQVLTGGNLLTLRAKQPVPLVAKTHLSGTFDGRAATLFVNGIEAASTQHEGRLDGTDQPVCLGGASPQAPAGFFCGLAYELRLFNLARSADQIRAWNNRLMLNASQPGLLLLMRP